MTAGIRADCPGSHNTLNGNTTIDGNVTVTGALNACGEDDTFIINGGQMGPLIIGTTDTTPLSIIQNNEIRLSIINSNTTIPSDQTLFCKHYRFQRQYNLFSRYCFYCTQ